MKITRILAAGTLAAFAASAAMVVLAPTALADTNTDAAYCSVLSAEGFYNVIGGCPEMVRQGYAIASDQPTCGGDTAPEQLRSPR